jgi:tripeptide aminopeptidase
MEAVVKTFIELAEIDEVHPHEDKVLSYIEKRLGEIEHYRDAFNNIVAFIPGETDEVIGVCGHVDIAAPLRGRKIVVTDTQIKTDGTGILGGDDKAAVAAMLELADALRDHPAKCGVELIFTRGEESGLQGALHLDAKKLRAKHVIVADWDDGPNHVVVKAPSYVKIDVTYAGKAAHPAEWQHGRNAGEALMKAAAGLKQGEYAPGVTFNIGGVKIGGVRNQVPGQAELMAEMRSFDREAVERASAEVKRHFEQVQGIDAQVALENDTPPYALDRDGQFFGRVQKALGGIGLRVVFDETYGCFDANILAGRGLDVVIVGTGFHHPHSVEEYVVIEEMRQLQQFLAHIVNA